MSDKPSTSSLRCGSRTLDLIHPRVMGVLNITPDSFYDGGRLYQGDTPALDLILQRAEQMRADGAAILDVGGESTRPGAKPVSAAEERDRVLTVVEAISHRLDTIISVDTSTPELMTECAGLGIGLINDIRALGREGAMEAARASGLPVCLMHMQGQPGTMQESPTYRDVTTEVTGYLQQRVDACLAAGIAADSLLLDPGFGFGKTVQHNLQLLAQLGSLADLGYPVLVGLSRKSMIGALLNREVEQRLPASLALASLAVMNGASIIRTHDVAETWDAVRIAQAVKQEKAGEKSE
jgi:dihydropteroate synthase